MRDDKKADTSVYQWLGWTLWTLSILVLAYPLSMAPAYRLMIGGRLPAQLIVDLYQPVIEVAYSSKPGTKLCDWYLAVWGVHWTYRITTVYSLSDPPHP